MTWFLGVDLSWGLKKPSWVCVLEGGKNSAFWKEFFSFVSLSEWEKRLTAFPHCIVAFDAPLRVSVQTGLRKAERELLPRLRKKGLGILPVNLDLVHRRYPGLLLFFASVASHFSLTLEFSLEGRYALEVFPPLSVFGFFGERGLTLYRTGQFQELGGLFDEPASPLRIENLNDCLVACLSLASGKKDRFDAFLCACTTLFAFQYGEKALQKFGDERSFIVAPLWHGVL